jgi:hypothetical protein
MPNDSRINDSLQAGREGSKRVGENHDVGQVGSGDHRRQTCDGDVTMPPPPLFLPSTASTYFPHGDDDESTTSRRRTTAALSFSEEKPAASWNAPSSAR